MNRREFIVGATSIGLVPESFAKDIPAGLKIRFLGTGAADWEGKDERGEQRRWSSVLVDDTVLVDFTIRNADMLPPDVRPDAIFYTHSHDDHYQPVAALKHGVRRVYVHESWAEGARMEFAEAAGKLGVAVPGIRGLAFGEAAEEHGVRFTIVPANHATSRKDECAAMYLIEKGGERLLYATDTGGIMTEAARIVGIDAHERGKPITALIMEATMGVEHADDFRIFAHSSVDTVARVVRVLTTTNRYLPTPGRKVYLTHLARTLHGTQVEIEKAVPSPLCPAFDGLEWILDSAEGRFQTEQRNDTGAAVRG